MIVPSSFLKVEQKTLDEIQTRSITGPHMFSSGPEAESVIKESLEFCFLVYFYPPAVLKGCSRMLQYFSKSGPLITLIPIWNAD